MAEAAAVEADTAIVNPDGVRDTSRRRGTTIRSTTEPGAIPALFVGTVQQSIALPVISSPCLMKESTRVDDLDSRIVR